VIPQLREFYGLQPTPPAELFQFFVWEILSENALPARRDLAWQALRRIPALTPDALFRAPAKELLDAVGMSGPHRDEKVESMRAVAAEFRRHRETLTSDALTRMTSLGAGRVLRRLDAVPAAARTRAMLFAADHLVLPMDGETRRVLSRLTGREMRRRSRLKQWLAAKLPRDAASYRDAIIYLRHHAQHTCTPVAPHCGVCPLATRCAFADASRQPSAVR
jgi:endonuclease III